MAATYKTLSELKPGAEAACEAFLFECGREGLDVIITETYRSQERQVELYAQGRTKPGKEVTWTLNSRHKSRQAWDITFKSTGYDDLSKFAKAGAIAQKLGITWGGKWSPPDNPHFEYKGESFKTPAANKEIRLEAENLAKKAAKAGLITDVDLWTKYLTGELPLKALNLKALVQKITGYYNSDNNILIDIMAKKGYLSDRELWLSYINGDKALTSNNLRSLYSKILK